MIDGSSTAETERAEVVAEATCALGVADLLQDMIWGHLSMRDPAGRGLWIKEAGIAFGEVTADRVHLLDAGGNVVVGSGRRHVEWHLHAQIYARRPDVNWIVHTHSQATNVFASLDIPLRAISHDAVLFTDPPLPRYPSGDLITDPTKGRSLAESLGEASACLMLAHGAVVAADTAPGAVMRAVLLARACTTAVAAEGAGGPKLWSDANELASKRRTTWPDAQLQAGYDYLVRLSSR